MFPNYKIARKYKQSETKVKYSVQFGIAKQDFSKTPFTFKFDETTTSQIKKQYDGYIYYWCQKTWKKISVLMLGLYSSVTLIISN